MAEKAVGTKSKSRVKELGEVYTPDSIVLDMLSGVIQNLKNQGYTDEDIVKETFLEPTCGDGQFLVRIYHDKLVRINKLVDKSDEELKRTFIMALTTVYGIDIDPENVLESKMRVLHLLLNGSVYTFDNKTKPEEKFVKIENPLFNKQWYKEVICDLYERLFDILNNNIIWGNMLDRFTSITTYDWNDDNTQVKVGVVSLSELEQTSMVMLEHEVETDACDYTEIKHVNTNDKYMRDSLNDNDKNKKTDTTVNTIEETDKYKEMYTDAISEKVVTVVNTNNKPKVSNNKPNVSSIANFH